MPGFNFFNLFSDGLNIEGSSRGDLIIGSFGDDIITGNGGNDLIFGLFGDDRISGGLGDDTVFGGFGHDTLEGGDGEDYLSGGVGDDRIVGSKGDDQLFGGQGNDMLVWNNGDGSDLMKGGSGHDQVQVNFNTDLVNDDLQNKDVVEFSVSGEGVQFARIELNDQTERGLFQLDIRETEALETNFGGGDDTAVIKDRVFDKIALDIDGGNGVDTLDLSQADAAIKVNLAAGKLGRSKAENFENVIGTQFDDKIKGDTGDNVISGLGGEDTINGRAGDDTLIGGKGNDKVFGGKGDDTLVWNNGDGSDLLNGSKGDDLVQVNFDTDLVNDDLQNKDVAEFSVTDQGVQFARIEVNDQTEAGLFQLDIRNTETLETNFGGGDDAAVIMGDVLRKIVLDLDGGDGVNLLDFSQAASAVAVDLGAGTINTNAPGAQASTANKFEGVTGTAFDDTIAGNDQDNVIRGGAGNDVMAGGEGADTFVFFEEDTGIDIITDFEFGVDSLAFLTTDPGVTTDNLMKNLTQIGDDVELALNNKVITFEDAVVTDFTTDDFMIA
ncbi:hemolysin type calcium-binding protein [Litoreibacter meonggei]|uniref:Hemolysin type calcium-binding protein n=1 Tax=Litoreibacter meonggei TaxID=1049199 RepID=A0A497VBS5_9RHOB|nr:calcium-binding protein [Litoreibacter meonggei]RLJ41031.1 hemolysin type calcium-binding protein [Litoreibacter meonggei]